MSWAGYLEHRAAFGEILDERYYTLPWLDQQVLGGQCRVWACDDAALITEIKEYPTGARDIHVLAAAGNMSRIVGELRSEAEEWARSIGCIGVLVESREGWGKALKPYGYSTHQTVVRKELVDGPQ